MLVQQFIEEFKNKKVQNTQVNPDAVGAYIRKTLEIKTYIPFSDKKQVAEMIIAANMTEENGIKKINSAGQFVSFITAMLMAHTNLEIDQADPIQSYDMLSESGLLEPIIAEFQKDYSECEAILKMTASDELADNNLNAVVARFLDGILDKLDGVSDGLKGMLEGIDLKKILGADITEGDLSQLKGFLDKYTN